MSNPLSLSPSKLFRNIFVFKAMIAPTICLLLALVPVVSADAAVLRACTSSQLSQAILSARPGDVIEMCDRQWADTVINFDVHGTKASPISLTAETPGSVVLTGSSQLLVSGNFAIVDGLVFRGPYTGVADTIVEFKSVTSSRCDDCRVTNLSIIDYNPPQSSDLLRWVVLHGKRNRLDHSHFRGKNTLGAMIQLRRGADQTPNNHRIDHNLLEDRPNFTGDGNQNGDTIEIGETGRFSHGISATTVEFNYLRNIDSDFEIITIKSSGNLIQYNVLESSRGVLSLRNGSGNVIHGNFILGRGKEGSGGIRIRGKNHSITSNYIYDVNPSANDALAGLAISDGTSEVVNLGGDGAAPYFKFERADNVQVRHNTVVNSGVSLAFGTGGTRPPRNIELTNNIYVQDTGEAFANLGTGTNILISNNLFLGDNLGISVTGIRNDDPKLVMDQAGIQRPTPQSPAINTALTASSTGFDMDGQPRLPPQDIGADEVIPDQLPRGPVSLCQVGPKTYRLGIPSACDGLAEGPRPLPPSSLSVFEQN